MMTKVCEKLGIDSPWRCTLCAARAKKVWICWGPQLNHWMTRSHRDSEKGGHFCNYWLCFFSHRFYPRGKLTQKYGQSPFWRGKSSRSLGHGFHSYVLLEGIQNHRNGRTPQSPSDKKSLAVTQHVATKTQKISLQSSKTWRIHENPPLIGGFSMIFHDFRSSVATRCLGHSAVQSADACCRANRSWKPRHKGRIRCILSDK